MEWQAPGRGCAWVSCAVHGRHVGMAPLAAVHGRHVLCMGVMCAWLSWLLCMGVISAWLRWLLCMGIMCAWLRCPPATAMAGLGWHTGLMSPLPIPPLPWLDRQAAHQPPAHPSVNQLQQAVLTIC